MTVQSWKFRTLWHHIWVSDSLKQI